MFAKEELENKFLDDYYQLFPIVHNLEMSRMRGDHRWKKFKTPSLVCYSFSKSITAKQIVSSYWSSIHVIKWDRNCQSATLALAHEECLFFDELAELEAHGSHLSLAGLVPLPNTPLAPHTTHHSKDGCYKYFAAWTSSPHFCLFFFLLFSLIWLNKDQDCLALCSWKSLWSDV